MMGKLKDDWWIAYLDASTFKDQASVQADSVSDAISEAQKVFIERHPELKDGGYYIEVEKGVMTSDSVEPDYYNMTLGDNDA